ncbi:MAG TPA: ATP-binding protein [Thermoanaerobaculaceae bacterium]|nr:ATP-binding protein [Thermoanaerobaculaceae bacterium]
MIVAIASGKGGTGKTTVALSLALAAGRPVRLLDCDVEEPNCHLFLDGEVVAREEVFLPTPAVDAGACTACGLCGEICEFGGIIVLPTGAYVFPTLCHACGACVQLCPAGALREVPRRIGELTEMRAGSITLFTGRLDVGQTLAPPLVRAVRARGEGNGLVIIDAPPGTSCPVVAAVHGADVAVLVTEPTPFGLHDLELAVEAVRRLQVPFGVVINRAGAGDARVADFCAREGISVLLEIPQERRIAEAYARGLPVVTAAPELRPAFCSLLDGLDRLRTPAVARAHMGS